MVMKEDWQVWFIGFFNERLKGSDIENKGNLLVN